MEAFNHKMLCIWIISMFLTFVTRDRSTVEITPDTFLGCFIKFFVYNFYRRNFSYGATDLFNISLYSFIIISSLSRLMLSAVTAAISG